MIQAALITQGPSFPFSFSPFATHVQENLYVHTHTKYGHTQYKNILFIYDICGSGLMR